ncbi:signal recognition particle-docking protein FtsY [Natrarchaeobaculum sulfurireducens]|uniref:Signal recognition particle receptor FtsY n=1 Tax=Natrarchaeobaculum sulfurireducens TaxID=2044521 RepID=A0A346PVE5_9EURY|nr:signal recognition particle-docking protein FtsY [Natrarchaeobaculum sulfurireducens]AXR79751.1 Signal recognition particle GTPase [Natrarchaeobaculum sulfurireducens]AXR83490.1 Signal recognition particle receptor protein FtsY [Natrarchaeobaculum sulfurireducens]
MFDNLKKKLGSFRKDAEEAAEENVEDVDEDELEELEDEETGAVDAELESDADGEPDADAGGAEPDSPTEATGADVEPAVNDEQSDESADGSELQEEAKSHSEVDAEAEAAVEDDEADAEAGETETDETTSENNSTGFGAKARSLVRGKFVIEEEDLEGPLHELELALLSSDVEMGVAQEILDNIRDELVGETRTFTTSTGEVVEEALRDAIYDVISVGQFDFDERIAVEDKPVTIVFTGVNGVGKTTSIAKLSRYFEERGYSTVMANGDTYRAGANEQIQEHADALETKLISHEQGGDPAAVLYDGVEYAQANDIDIVLGDTAGRLHTDEGLMDQLEKIDRVVGPDLTLFVDEAVAGQDAVNRAREFNEAAEIDGAILTKADADSNGGAAISVAHVTGKPILFLGVGQGYDDIEPFDPDEMVDRLLAEE